MLRAQRKFVLQVLPRGLKLSKFQISFKLKVKKKETAGLIVCSCCGSKHALSLIDSGAIQLHYSASIGKPMRKY